MALFKSSKQTHETVKKNETVSTATIITKGSTIKGDITGDDTIHIDGRVEGSIQVNNVVVIGKSGVVIGDIAASKVISSGRIDGIVHCEECDVMESSTVNQEIHAHRVEVRGKVSGTIVCDTLTIEESGQVGTLVQAKHVIVSGTLNGDVACELLSTRKTGFIKGKMYVSNINNEGGVVEGAIGQYKELVVRGNASGVVTEE